MKPLYSLIVGILLFSGLYVVAGENENNQPIKVDKVQPIHAKPLWLVITWGWEKKPDCRLVREVSPDGLYAIFSDGGNYSAGGKVQKKTKDGYPVVISMFTRYPKGSLSMVVFEKQVKLGEVAESIVMGGVARRYSFYLTDKNPEAQVENDE